MKLNIEPMKPAVRKPLGPAVRLDGVMLSLRFPATYADIDSWIDNLNRDFDDVRFWCDLSAWEHGTMMDDGEFVPREPS